MYPQHSTPSQTTHRHTHYPGTMVNTRGKQRETSTTAPNITTSTPPTTPVDPRFPCPLPMIHGCDLTIPHLSHDAAVFIPFSPSRYQDLIRPRDDLTLDPVQGFIHPAHPIYKYGGPVYRVQHRDFGLMDTMLCDTRICGVCNPRDAVMPRVEESPTKGLPFVHTLRDCEEAEEDRTLQFWQVGRHAMVEEVYPEEMKAGKVRFTNIGMWGTRDAMCCVPESCWECKGLIGMARIDSGDGSLTLWKEKKSAEETVDEEAREERRSSAELMPPPPRPVAK